MNKIKNVFQRSQKLKAEDNRRPQQFVKRHSSIRTADALTTPPQEEEAPPSIDLVELSEMEKPIYESWWKDLDPFNLEIINNETVVKFLSGCTLEDNKLEQILALFDSVKDGLSKYQFFAMLRLIAHAQNGRKISKALIYLGAPIPQFNTNAAIQAVISPEKTVSTPGDRKSWWGYENQQQQQQQQQQHLEHRRSYVGPFTAHTTFENSDSFLEFYYNNRPVLTNSATSASNIPVITPPPQQQQQHSRSKSAGHASDFITTTTNPYYTATTTEEEEEEEKTTQLQSSRSSLSLNELNNNDTGRSLLLTQKFVYQPPSLSKNNPFNIPSYEDLQQQKSNPFNTSHDEKSPFDDDNSSDINNKPNAQNIPPPPVPDQSTKPLYPKYARRTTIKRSQSIANNSAKKTSSNLQRHKSTSAATQ